MFEFFLWLMVSDWPRHHWQEDPYPADEEAYAQEESMLDTSWERLNEKLRQACDHAGMNFENFNCRDAAGGVAVTAGFTRNHAFQDGIERQFLEELIELAPTTYGVLYTHDTDRENPDGEFTVLKVGNGKVIESREYLVR
jgi:hypothetical protein